ncbi:MAG: hypothetical protein J0M19_02650 [Sphingomonadales bacterium]|nr:hypothetical protein [Sphingomonadales bacterium]
MNRTRKVMSAAGILTLAALGAQPAFAAGTAAGSTITNTATVNYQVGSVAQTATTASDTLTVDRKVNLTVAEVGTTTTQVTPGQTSAVTTFTVTNTSNATLDFALTAVQPTGGTAAHGGTDSFNGTNVRIFVDTNTNGVFDSGTDTQVTYLDELAADGSRTVFVVSDIPLGLANGAVAGVTLTATGREGGTASSQGAALTQTTTANTAGMDTVFADTAGATDAARDAAFSARDDYTVFTATLTVLKTSTIISDPLNGTTNPKMIPGATIEYCISVSNAAGGADATNVAVSDPLPGQITYDAGYGIKLNGTVVSGNCQTDGTAGGTFSSNTVNGTIASLPAGSTKTVLFRATIN